MAERDGREHVSITKACEVAGVSRRTIYNWIRDYKVESFRLAGGSLRIYVDTLWTDDGLKLKGQL